MVHPAIETQNHRHYYEDKPIYSHLKSSNIQLRDDINYNTKKLTDNK